MDEQERGRAEGLPKGGAPPRSLIVQPRTGAARRYVLGPRLVTIGRAADADIVLGDATVSSVHARIEPAAGGHRLIDCHSRNGTLLNDERVGERALRLGDRIRIGSTVLIYAEADAPLEIAAPVAAAMGTPPSRPRVAASAAIGGLPDDTTTMTVAPVDFDIDFLEPKTMATDRASEAALERRLVGLYKAAKTLTPIGDASPVEPRLARLVQDLLGVMRATLIRAPLSKDAPEPGDLQYLAHELVPQAPSFESVPLAMVTVREAIRNRRALLYRRPSSRAGEGRDTPASAVIVPLAVPSEPRLFIYADVFEPWPPIHHDDLRLLGILARHAGVCLENQRLQRALLEANRELERKVERRTRELVDSAKLAAVGTLASGVAHEFNNVLAVIMGNAELVQQIVAMPAEGREHLDTIMDAARRSKEIVRHLLLFSRRRDPRREAVNLVELVESTLRLLGSDLTRARARLRRTFAALPPVLGQPDQLSLVVLNLVRNARDAIAEKGGGELHVSLGRRPPASPESPAYAVLEVRDEGAGMAPAVRERLFEPFFTTKPPGQGTGLGLSTAYGIVQAHGGSIEVETAPGAGTLVRVLVPLDTTDVAELPAGEIAVASGAPVGAEASALHILVVDDDAAVRSTLAAMIKRLGHNATCVASGAEALGALGAARFDLVLADHGMASMDGLALRAEIRKRLPEQRFILITGNADVEELARKHDLAPGEFLRKPFTFRQITELLARVAAGDR